MKLLCLTINILVLLFSNFKVFASASKHMVNFGSNGFGGSYYHEKNDTRGSSHFENVHHIFTTLGLNYAYLFNNRIQLGGFYNLSKEKYDFNPRDSGEAKNDVISETYGIVIQYNFSPELHKAFYTGISLAHFSIVEENSATFQEAEGKNPYELDDAGLIYEIFIGKRFTLLKSNNSSSLNFSPQFGVFHKTHSKDFDDQDIKNSTGLNLQLIKFDFFF